MSSRVLRIRAPSTLLVERASKRSHVTTAATRKTESSRAKPAAKSALSSVAAASVAAASPVLILPAAEEPLTPCLLLRRPSASVRTPWIADVIPLSKLPLVASSSSASSSSSSSSSADGGIARSQLLPLAAQVLAAQGKSTKAALALRAQLDAAVESLLAASGPNRDAAAAHVAMAHAPALECAGMVLPGAIVWCSRNGEASTARSQFAIQQCEEVRSSGDGAESGHDNGHGDGLDRGGPMNGSDEQSLHRVRVGYHPQSAERISRALLDQRILSAALCGDRDRPSDGDADAYDTITAQHTIGRSRFDYALSHRDGRHVTIVEVKNVVGADFACDELVAAARGTVGVYVSPEAQVIGGSASRPPQRTRSAIFPHGAHKTVGGIGVVSDRAIKHVHELTALHGTRCATTGREVRSAILFLVNRADCARFRPCHEADALFARVLLRAHRRGVRVLAVSVQPRDDGSVQLVDARLPVWFDPCVRVEDIDEAHLQRVLEFNADAAAAKAKK
jgi:hypothetical protein